MTGKRYGAFILVSLLTTLLWGQQVVRISGQIRSSSNEAIPFATVSINQNNLATTSNNDGLFSLNGEVKFPLTLSCRSVGFITKDTVINSFEDISKPLYIKLDEKTETINEVVVVGKGKNDESFQKIEIKAITLMPDASGGNIESLVKTQLGVTSNNELSSQYKVRGGNFDENIIYVNDIEVYRPFLVRSGQQEGLSFVNPDLVKELSFSAGGFDSKYSDKMSSVLDITYKKPQQFAASVSASLMGATVHAEGASKNNKLTAIFGSRYKTNKMLLGTLDTEGEYDPTFVDFQTYLTYNFCPKFEVGLLGYYGQTSYLFQPVSRQTSFGTISNIQNLYVFFEGNEEDMFASGLLASTFTYKANTNNKYALTLSAYSTRESETYDIESAYWLQDLDPTSGSTDNPNYIWENGNSKDVGSELDHARNSLNGEVLNAAFRATHLSSNNKITWETKIQSENFEEEINQWNYLDSAGYSLPYNGTSIELQNSYNAHISTETYRTTAFIQDDYNFNTEKGKISLSGGIRGNYWTFNQELLISPRAAIVFEPYWKRQVMFRFATGIYYQSPFVKELHTPDGTMNNDIKAQKSIQYVFTTTYTFEALNRRFKLSSEFYYKQLSQLNPYNIDNVRIVYSGKNNAKGYATGADFKINGEIVKGLESWATLSLMKTEENLVDDSYTTTNSDGTTTTTYPGYIPRPTDQRFNFSLYFQDYIPKYPSIKAHLNLVFGSGLPFGPPDSPRYKSTLRMPPYRRVDLGVSKEITGSLLDPDKRFGPFKRLWLGIDIFNLFNINNTISYYWVTDIRSQQYAVPNYLTSRRMNFKVVADF